MTIRDIMVAFGVEQDKSSFSKAESAINGLKSFATKVLGGIALAIGFTNLNQFKAECVELASNLEQVQQKFDVVYGGEGSQLANDAEKWAKQYADSVGRNTNTIKQYMADNQNLITGFIGTSEEARAEAAKLTEQMVKSALDLASFNNISDDDAIYAMSKAMMGETEAAKRLGAVLNDVTRAQAMEELGLKGKYQALSQAEKMQVNYKAIMDQSQDSIGDCVRSMASYESRQRQLNAKIKEYKEYLGTMLLPIQNIWVGLQVKAVKWITELTKKIIGENAEENRLVRTYEYFMATLKKLQPLAERVMQSLRNGASKAKDVLSYIVDNAKKLIERLGGIENVMKLLAIVAGAVATAIGLMKLQSFLTNAEKVVKIVTALKNVFSLTTLKILGLIAVFVVIALVIEDFINFMQGNDSVIGLFFDKIGIGSDNARKKIIEGWTAVRNFLVKAWKVLKTAGGNLFGSLDKFIKRHKTTFDAMWRAHIAIVKLVVKYIVTQVKFAIEVIKAIFNALKLFWDKWGDRIMAFFAVVWETLGGFIDGFMVVLKGLCEFIEGVLTGDWERAWQGIYDFFVGIGEMIKNFVIYVIALLKLYIEMGCEAIRNFWQFVWYSIKNIVVTVWNAIVAFIAEVIMAIAAKIQEQLNLIKEFWSGVWEAIKSKTNEIWTAIVAAILAFLLSIYTSVSEKINQVKATIVNGFNAACNFLKSLPAKAFQWGSDFISGLINGISSKIGELKTKVGSVAGTIKSYLHFSVPDVGPLTTYQSWMPDFMKGLAEGIKLDRSNPVLKKIAQFSTDVSRLAQAGFASNGTVGASSYNNMSRSIVQNVNIDNTYSGGTVESQHNMSKAMKKSATDATTYMARGLAFTRG